MKHALYVLIILALVFGLGGFVVTKTTHAPTVENHVTSFEECVAAGNAVMESYPRQCRDADGMLFVEDISDDVADKGEIEQGITVYDSGVHGTVLVGPTCPVAREGEECSDAPLQGTINVYRVTTQNVIFTYVQSDAAGMYEVTLPPGTYVLQAQANNAAMSCDSVTIEVAPQTTSEQDLSCDSGIR